MFACSYKATMKQSPNHVFFRIKGHQLNLCFCISVFACFENIFWSACRAQVLTPLTFLPRSCLPRSFPERHNCTVAPKVLYLFFSFVYICVYCIHVFACFAQIFLAFHASALLHGEWRKNGQCTFVFLTDLHFTLEKKLCIARKHSTQISSICTLVQKGLEIYKLLVDKVSYSILMPSLLCWRKQT